MNETRVYATCNVCFKECSKGDLMDHVRSHMKKRHAAPGEGNNRSGLKLDMLENVPKRFECEQCHKLFAHEGRFKSHVESHFMEKSLACDICGKLFALKSQLSYHHRSHFKYFECMLCESSFSSEYTLRQHLSTHTGEKPFVCSICDAKFSSTNYLRRHQRIHTPIANCHICQTCQQAFCTASQLRTHQHIHTGVKPYLCSLCQKSFTQRHNFNDHMNTHTGETPYSCETCGEKFYKRKVWRFHRALHSECYRCDVCEKVFSRKDRLKEHFRTHIGVKPFVCDICEKTFLSSSLLNRHVLVHKVEKSYQCDICPKKFTQSRYLYRHIQRHLRKGEGQFNVPRISVKTPDSLGDPSLDDSIPDILLEDKPLGDVVAYNSPQSELETNDSIWDIDNSPQSELETKDSVWDTNNSGYLSITLPSC